MLTNQMPAGGLLQGKTALVYGAGGAIGGAVSRAFAAEGATVHLAGRTESRLEKVARDIRQDGGRAEIAVVDALDEEQVDAFVDAVAKKTKRIDISVNVISFGDIQQPLMEIDANDFTQPITLAARTHFLTTRAAAGYMVKQKSGVVLMFGGSGPQTLPGLGGFKVALDAMEGQRRQWALHRLGKSRRHHRRHHQHLQRRNRGLLSFSGCRSAPGNTDETSKGGQWLDKGAEPAPANPRQEAEPCGPARRSECATAGLPRRGCCFAWCRWRRPARSSRRLRRLRRRGLWLSGTR
jgi:3-oxoacyl-[acyl-carrier protein] reductase